MFYSLLADSILVAHLGFIVFVVLGGLLALRWPRLAFIHLPVAAYGVLIEVLGWVCPLTPLENALRRAAGEAGYAGGFIEHYLLPIIYPGGLTRELQVRLAVLLVALNLGIYVLVWLRRARRA